MSKSVKKIVSIALPIAAMFIPGIGPLASAAIGAAAGAIGGGGLKGAALGGVTGYIGGGGFSSGASNAASAASTPVSTAGTAARTVAKSYGSAGAPVATGAAMTQAAGGGSLGGTIFDTLKDKILDPSRIVTSIGNQLMTTEAADTAKKSANIQSDAIDRGIAAQQAGLAQQMETQQPYLQQGTQAMEEINRINSDRAGYVANDPMYKSLAADAESRLLANQAAKGKVGSGETAAALQDRLMMIGNDLISTRVNSLQGQVGVGQNAANQVGSAQYNTGVNNANMTTDQGAVQAAGKVGQFNAYNAGYQNNLNTLLAYQSLQRTPTYAPTVNV